MYQALCPAFCWNLYSNLTRLGEASPFAHDLAFFFFLSTKH